MPDFDSASDEDLACRARTGSRASFEELVRRYQVPLLRFLQRRCVRPEDAEDLVQDAFLRAFKALDKYREEYRFKTWLFTIAYRLAISSGRSARPAMTIINETVSSNHDEPDARAIDRESHDELWGVARRELTGEQYTALWLHYVEETSPRQIAVVMGRSWVWVRTALHRAKRKMMDALTNDGAVPNFSMRRDQDGIRTTGKRVGAVVKGDV